MFEGRQLTRFLIAICFYNVFPFGDVLQTFHGDVFLTSIEFDIIYIPVSVTLIKVQGHSGVENMPMNIASSDPVEFKPCIKLHIRT